VLIYRHAVSNPEQQPIGESAFPKEDCPEVRMWEVVPTYQLPRRQHVYATYVWCYKGRDSWILAETGIRLGEGCALRPSAFNLDLQVVVIRSSAWRSIHVGSTKSKRPRVFNISPQLAAHLRVFLANTGADEFLFQRKDGSAWQGDHVVRDHLQPLLRQLGIKVAGAHAFRHFNSSLMDHLRTPDKVRQDRLGQVDFNDVTLGMYTHADSQDHCLVAEQLGKVLAPAALANMPTIT
jgi:integrase